MILENYFGLILFLATLLLMIFIVPLERIKQLFVIGLLGGFGGGLVLIYVLQNIFGFWEFQNRADLIFFLDIPIFISLSWLPIVITFCHLLTQYKNIPLIVGIIVSVPLAAVFIKYLMLENGMLNYVNWNLFDTFLVSIGIHIGITTYMYFTNRLENFKKIL